MSSHRSSEQLANPEAQRFLFKWRHGEHEWWHSLQDKEKPGQNKVRLYYEDPIYQEWFLPVACQAADGGRDGIKISSFHSFCLTFGRSQQTSLPSVWDSMCLFCLQDSQADTKAEVKTSVSLCYLQKGAAFCLRDHSTAKALAGGLDLPGSVAGWTRGTDLTRANISRTLAAST